MLPFALWDSVDALCPPRLGPPVVLTHPKIKGFLISFFNSFIHSFIPGHCSHEFPVPWQAVMVPRTDLKMGHDSSGSVGPSLPLPCRNPKQLRSEIQNYIFNPDKQFDQ